MNVNQCIDLPLPPYGVEDSAMKLCLCWDFLFTVAQAILGEQADTTPQKVSCHQRRV